MTIMFLCNRLFHPTYKSQKTYQARLFFSNSFCLCRLSIFSLVSRILFFMRAIQILNQVLDKEYQSTMTSLFPDKDWIFSSNPLHTFNANLREWKALCTQNTENAKAGQGAKSAEDAKESMLAIAHFLELVVDRIKEPIPLSNTPNVFYRVLQRSAAERWQMVERLVKSFANTSEYIQKVDELLDMTHNPLVQAPFVDKLQAQHILKEAKERKAILKTRFSETSETNKLIQSFSEAGEYEVLDSLICGYESMLALLPRSKWALRTRAEYNRRHAEFE